MKPTKSSARTSWARARRKVLASLSDVHVQFLRTVCRVDEPTYPVIAEAMHLKLHEVHATRQWLFQEFDIHSKAGLVMFAYRWGIVSVK